MPQHPEDIIIEQFAIGALDNAEAFVAHVATCDACSAKLERQARLELALMEVHMEYVTHPRDTAGKERDSSLAHTAMVASSVPVQALAHAMDDDRAVRVPALVVTRTPRRWLPYALLPVAAALGLMALGLGAAVVASRPIASSPAVVATPAGRTPTTKPLTNHGATNGDNEGQVRVTLKATPLETRFTIDDGARLENPFIGYFPKDGKPHTILAVAPGYPPKEEVVTFDDNISIRFALAPRQP